jgi:molecular chaperone DnaK (HSP70)
MVQLNKIRWVLTVPALWSEEHKLFMRKAAKEAEIIDHSNSPNLLLCLEPEGASIQCREDAEDSLKEKMVKDSIVLVLDCGGGTVDITVHKLSSNPEENFLCEEILPSSGGCEWGSKYVDKYFEEFLKDFFGNDLFEIYTKNAIARLEILKHFEMLKRKFNPGKDDRSRLQLSYLSEELSQTKLGELVELHNKNHPKDLHIKQRGASCIDLPPNLVMSFFQPLFENIMSKVDSLIEQAYNKAGYKPKFIFMVGGFSESPYLKSEIKARFEKEDMLVLVPRRPQVSVIRGACMYGLNPRTITSRIAKKTYGINTLTTFDPERHPEEKKVVIEGEDFCEDVFDIFVRKNESVSIDEFHTKIYCPVRSRQTVMRIIFYCTEATDVEFVDEKGVTQLGELSVDIGKPFQSVEDKTVKVTLMFGSTHIFATATNKDATEVKKCEFKFEASS